MTSTRYVLTPDPGTILDDYVQAAIAAITAIAGRPLESLDGIPEHLRHLFREETYVTFTGPAKKGEAVYKQMDATFTTIQATPIPSPSGDPTPCFKVSVHPDAVKADDLGWIDTFKPAAPEDSSPEDDQATLSAMGYFLTDGADDGCFDTDRLFSAICRGEVPGLPSPHEFAKVKAERDTFRELRDHDTEAFATLNKALDDLGIVVHDTYGEAIKAEVERLRIESSNHAAQAEQYRREVVALRMKYGEF